MLSLRDKLFPLGIRSKLLAVVLGVTVLLTILLMLYVQIILRSALNQQLDHKTISTSRNVAARSVEPILTNNVFELHRLAYNTLETSADVEYVFFQDEEGNMLAHTFQEYFPPDILEIDHSLEGEEYSLQKFRSEQGTLRDIAVPVFPDNESEAVARVGLIDHSLQAGLTAATRQLLLIAGIVFIITCIIVYMLTTLIAVKPINSLLMSVQAVSEGDLSQRVIVKSRDELNKLAIAFNNMTQRLSRAQKTRNYLMKKLIHSQEEERRRISRELHDETGQSLMTLMIALRFLEESQDLKEMKNRATEFRNILMQSLEQVRSLAWNLTPTPLADLGLKAALESFVKKFNKNDDWDIDLQIEGLGHKRLSEEVEISIYRVIQEALTNIAKHARASQINITLKCRGDNIELTIEDDGIGFDMEKLQNEGQSKKSLGLISMKERINLLGGTFDIQTAPSQGTTLYIKCPCQHDQQENSVMSFNEEYGEEYCGDYLEHIEHGDFNLLNSKSNRDDNK